MRSINQGNQFGKQIGFKMFMSFDRVIFLALVVSKTKDFNVDRK